ncbi:hypothetical protein [Mechercharimyces sp. CAU 1602]|uniref:hypothetical protein n=1 Tax=Mechercharimyces sp. CAU 1602 TaxID=2973933 RepID=UPI0021617AB4|nr:hypothetical protein [Mechercharimyces sp. CAU 1602]MCS1350398.1 hypothetical protein [Mechercharimyces sp. CAU 1602]
MKKYMIALVAVMALMVGFSGDGFTPYSYATITYGETSASGGITSIEKTAMIDGVNLGDEEMTVSVLSDIWGADPVIYQKTLQPGESLSIEKEMPGYHYVAISCGDGTADDCFGYAFMDEAK